MPHRHAFAPAARCFASILALAALTAVPAARADQTWLVSTGIGGDTPAGTTYSGAMSADGRYVALTSDSTGWVPGVVDLNAGNDTYLWDRQTDLIVLVSHAASSPTMAGNGQSYPSALSADGRYLAFSSSASNLIAGGSDTNQNQDMFLWDRDTGVVTLVSHASESGTSAANGSSLSSVASADGQYVAFESYATNLIAGGVDANGTVDLFLWDRDTGSMTLVSHAAGTTSTTGNAPCSLLSMSADGRYLAFSSRATNLIAGGSDTNLREDLFLWDRDTGSVALVSHSAGSGTTAGNGESSLGTISADGQYMAFSSKATDLIAGGIDTNALDDAFLWNRTTGQVTLVSHVAGLPTTAASGRSSAGAMSTDGRYMALSSFATNLIAGVSDLNAAADAFLWDRTTGVVRLVSHASGSGWTAGNQPSHPGRMSADGRYLVVSSAATDLIAGGSDTNGANDTFLWDRDTGLMTLVSHASESGTTAANSFSTSTAISADGRFVGLYSEASDLVAGGNDTNRAIDAFLWDRLTGQTVLVSHASHSGPVAANGYAGAAAPSAAGRYVAFSSPATNLIAGGSDSNNLSDVFHWERVTGGKRLVSHAVGTATTAGNGYSDSPVASTDGRYVAFQSAATNLIAGGIDTNGASDVFQWDRNTGSVTLVSHAAEMATTTGNGYCHRLAMSADGRYVAFSSRATNLIAGGSDTNGILDVFLWDRVTGLVDLVSHASGSTTTAGNGYSFPPVMVTDGGQVLFDSSATDLIAGGSDTNSSSDVFLWDWETGSVTLVSRAAASETTAGNGTSEATAVSAGGRYVAFVSSATNLIANGIDTNSTGDAFLWDRTSGKVTLVSHAAGSETTAGNANSPPTAMSADGRYVAMYSDATDLIAGGSDTNGTWDAFQWDRETGAVTLVSHASGSGTTAGNDYSYPAAMSADGRHVLFSSYSTDLIAGGSDTVQSDDVYSWNRDTGSVRLVSHALGSETTAGNRESAWPVVSANGRYVAFVSWATDLIAGDFYDDSQLFLWAESPDETTAPTNPGIDSTFPVAGVWSNDRTVEVSWSGAFDEAGGSGLDGYSVAWDQVAVSTPDLTVDVLQGSDPHATTSVALADAADWWFHLRTCDLAGNCTTAVHAGPFQIDATAPGAPGAVSSPSHGDSQPKSDPTIEVAWGAALDVLSGVAGYSVVFDGAPASPCGESSTTAATSWTSNALPDGTWYAHVCAVDVAGNWGALAHGGPYAVDTTAPRVTAVSTVRDTGDGVLSPGEVTGASVTQLLVTFDEAMGSGAAEAGSYRVIEAGSNGLLETVDCEPLGGDDVAVALGAVSFDAGIHRSAVRLAGATALPVGHYGSAACAVLTDPAGNELDGNGDGTPGDAHTRLFGVAETNLLANPNFDSDLSGWTVSAGRPQELAWNATDADALPISGSARVETVAGAEESWLLSQCVPVSPHRHYRVELATRTSGGEAGGPAVALVTTYWSGAACGGVAEAIVEQPVPVVPGGGWLTVRKRSDSPSTPNPSPSARMGWRVQGGTATSFTVEADQPFFGEEPLLLFVDDFEAGDLAAWSERLK